MGGKVKGAPSWWGSLNVDEQQSTKELLMATPMGKEPRRVYSMDEVRKHNSEEDAWVVIEGRIFNVTGYDTHPGGRNVFEQCAGKDVSDVFLMYHPLYVVDLLKRYYVGDLDTSSVDERSALMKEFHEIDSELHARGFYKTRLTYYIGKALCQLALLAVALYPFVFLEPHEQSFAVMTASAFSLGFFWDQMAYLGHDFGHNSVFHNDAGDYWGSLLVVLLFGVSGQWWKSNHNVHHVVTNSVQGDPDIQYLPVFMLNSRFLQPVYSFYHKKRFVFDKAAQFLVSYQHFVFYPLMCVARHNLYVQSWLCVLFREDIRHRKAEMLALTLYAGWLLELVLRIESGWMALWWWLLAHATCSLLHVTICLSHFSMECHNADSTSVHRTAEDSFVEHQMATTLDIDCPKWLDWIHGGLQFQVVHHLWPRLPRHVLREVRDEYLLPLAKKYGLQYNILSFWGANVKTYQHLREHAMKARVTPPVTTSMLRQATNAYG